MDTTPALLVAQTILSQLGGSGRLSAMVGAHSFTGSADTLTFKFKARAKNGANTLRIKLDPSDTYVVEFLSLRGTGLKVKGTFEMVYAEDLVRLFESETGLALSL